MKLVPQAVAQILDRKIDDLVGACIADNGRLLHRRNARDHPGAERFGELHCRKSHASCGTEDQHAFTGNQAGPLTQREPGGVERQSHASSIRERHRGGDQVAVFRQGSRLLGITALLRGRQHPVPHGKAGDVSADRNDPASG